MNIDLQLNNTWDVITLALFVLALLTSSGFLVNYIRSFIVKKTEENKLDTVKIIKSQIDYLEEQIETLTLELKKLSSTNEETKLHKIELMKKNIILIEEIKAFKKENKLLREQNDILNKQLDQLKANNIQLKMEIEVLEVENQKLKIS